MVVPLSNSNNSAPNTTFTDIGVPDALLRVLRRMRLTAPTPIQSATIPDALAGRDVVGKSPTGSGKTVAFGIPLVARLSDGGASLPGHPRALVVSPTRELADQIADVIADLAVAAGLRVLSLVGGENVQRQRTLLAAPVDILVITPGRAHDLKRRGLLSLDSVEAIVIDEADLLADLGFLPEVRGLVRACPRDCQRLLFSATMSAEAHDLVTEGRRKAEEPAIHSVSGSVVSVDKMRHLMLRVADNEQADETISWLASRENQCVIFANTKDRVIQLAKMLSFWDISVDCLHGDRGQTARRAVLEKFNSGALNVLVATDVAARGIDIDSLDLVVHADPPFDAATYVHRSGRTARAGQSGTVALLVRDRQSQQAVKLLDAVGVTAEVIKAQPGLPLFVKETGARRPKRRVAAGEKRVHAGAKKSRQHRPKRTKRNRKK